MTPNRDAAFASLGRKQAMAIAAVVLIGTVAAVALLRNPLAQPAGDEHAHEAHDEHEEAAAPKGPHGGDWFTEGDFALEAQLVEAGGDPRLKVWLFQAGKPLPPPLRHRTCVRRGPPMPARTRRSALAQPRLRATSRP